MATTARIILTAACLLAQGLGSMASTGTATMADGAATVVEDSMEDEADTTVVVDLVAEAGGMAVVDSAGTRASTAAEDSMVAASAAVMDFGAAAMAEASTAAAEVGSMAVAEVASTAVAAGPTGEATGNSNCRLHSHVNGWQRMLPAVFLFLSFLYP
jgi:hypothetical protein